jgi:hypothetical protein
MPRRTHSVRRVHRDAVRGVCHHAIEAIHAATARVAISRSTRGNIRRGNIRRHLAVPDPNIALMRYPLVKKVIRHKFKAYREDTEERYLNTGHDYWPRQKDAVFTSTSRKLPRLNWFEDFIDT